MPEYGIETTKKIKNMQQPELGKKIAGLRKAKGLTQEDLVQKCNLNVRTLQRIESGEVTPRSYTLKLISAELGYEFFGNTNTGFLQWFVAKIYVSGKHINFKKNTMKKISILSSTLLVILLGVFMMNFIISDKAKSILSKQVNEHNRKSVEWFNSGRVDLLLSDYASDAFFYRNGHPVYQGKKAIGECMRKAIDAKVFKMTRVELISLSINGNLAVEKSLTTSELSTGEIIKTINIKEWQQKGKRWKIVNDIDVLILE